VGVGRVLILRSEENIGRTAVYSGIGVTLAMDRHACLLFERGAGGVYITTCTTIYTRTYGYL
jgi:hypothetical protein